MPSSIDTAHGKICSRCGKRQDQLPSGEWRCTPCRTEERNQQRHHVAYRAERAAIDGHGIKRLKKRAIDGETLDDDEWMRLIADDPDTDWGDEIGDRWDLWVGAGLITPTETDLRRADALFASGAARGILQRAGVTIAEFCRRTGAGRRATHIWLTGRPPKSAKARGAVAVCLLTLAEDNETSDIMLRAHDLETTLEAQRRFEKTHKPLDLDDPAAVCEGCARARRARRGIKATRQP